MTAVHQLKSQTGNAHCVVCIRDKVPAGETAELDGYIDGWTEVGVGYLTVSKSQLHSMSESCSKQPPAQYISQKHHNSWETVMVNHISMNKAG